ncbi:hypothetical protein ABPG75_010920 [Micractinium tetrahymenae]
MDFWKSALAAAEKAAEAAKDLGKKGLEVVEATAEEASKKLNLNMYDKVGAGGAAAAPPSAEELSAYGVTPEFAEFVHTLNYSAFRDFPAEHLLPAGGEGGGSSSSSSTAAAVPGGPAYRLNPWQVRHATLVVQALKEVNELRFVLCPKYMTDEHFWHVYFTLARKYLPDAAFSWTPGQPLLFADKAAAAAGGSGDAFSLTELGDQLKRLGSKIQSATSAGAQRGLEFTTSLTRGAAAGAAASSSSGPSAEAPAAPGATAAGAGGAGLAAAAGAAGAADAAAGAAPASSLLEEDPDLEAYLQVAINTSGGGSGGEEEGSGGYDEVGDEDLDLDSYINELSAEVEAAAAAEEEGGGGGAGEAAAAGGGEDAAAAKQD